jgi:hypothetical protein
MGNRISSDNLTRDQLCGLLEDLRRQDATVAITVTASHYEEYVETTVEQERSDLHHARRSSPKWETWTGGRLPSGAVCGGEDQGGLLYVARASHQGGVVPGKFHVKYKTGYISWGGEEHEKSGCEVLVGAGLRWEAAQDGAVPQGAVPAGEDGDGAPLYVARAKVDGQDTIGKVNPRHQKHAHLPYGGKEHVVRQFEVLVSEPLATTNTPKVHRTVKQRKVETFRTEQQVPLTYCQDLTGQILLPQLTKDSPIMKVTLALEVSPMDALTSDRLDQLKLHLASQHQNKDKIVETEAVFSMMGFKKIQVGQTVSLTAHEPAFKDKAQAGFLCFGSAGVKNANVTVIKKFSLPTLHFSGNQLLPLPGDQGAPPPQPQPPSYQYPATPSAPGYPQTTTWGPPPPSAYPPPPSGYPPPPSGYPPPPSGYPPQPSGYPLPPAQVVQAVPS